MSLRFEYTDAKNFSAPLTSSSGPVVSETLLIKNGNGDTLFSITDDGIGNVSISIAGALAVAGGITQAGLSLTAAFVYKGALDCSANPNWPAASAGDVYKVSVAGKIGGASGQVVQAGDVLTCNVSGIAGTDAAVGANWMIQQGNVVSTADVPDSTNKRYVTDAQSTAIGNLGGINTGDQTLPTLTTLGIKSQRVTTSEIGGGLSALVTLTWAVAFADDSYTVTASVQDSTAGLLSLAVVHVETISASAVVVRVSNTTVATPITGTLHLIAVHD